VFPNVAWRAVDEELVRKDLGARMNMLEWVDLKYESVDEIPKEMYPIIPQDHPAWGDIRVMLRFTASMLAKFASMHDHAAAEYLGMSETMFEKGPYSEDWDLIIARMKWGKLPRPPMEPPGWAFCEGGIRKEINANSAFLRKNPEAIYQDRGLTPVTEQQLNERGIFYAFAGDYTPPNAVNPVFAKSRRDYKMAHQMGRTPIAPFPVDLAASPDGLVTMPDPTTGGMITRACEWKCPTPFIPMDKTSFPGASFFLVENRKPYEKPPKYYLPQMMLQMLATGTTELFFGAWTYKRGMRVWLITFNAEFMSLLLSVLKFHVIHHCNKGKRVPTDYFMKDLAPSDDDDDAMDTDDRHATHKLHKSIYKRMLDLATEISEGAPIWQMIDGEFTKETADLYCKEETDPIYLHLPNEPDAVPAYMKIFCYARAIFGDDYPIKWVAKFRDLEGRHANLELLCNNDALIYVSPMMAALDTEEAYPEGEARELYVVKNETTERLEKFMVRVLKRIHRHYIYKGPNPTQGKLIKLYMDNAEVIRVALGAFFHDEGIHVPQERALDISKALEAMKASHPFSLAWHMHAVSLCKDIVETWKRRATADRSQYRKFHTIDLYVEMLDRPEYWLSENNLTDQPNTVTLTRIAAAHSCIEDIIAYFEG
jgi:hypothetical protein